MTRDLEGEVAVVTGAGRGFGRVVAEHLGRAGATVALVARTPAEIENAAASIQGNGGRAIGLALDVTDPDAVEGAFADVDRSLGPVSILVNNAGTLDAVGPFRDIDPALWWREVEIHLRGTILCTHAALARMIPRGGGRVVSVGGMLGQRGEPYSTAYTCAKAAIYRFSECLAEEVAEDGVRVFCMSPGPVQTRLTEALVSSDRGQRWLPEFAALSEEEWVPPEVGAELIVRLARGDADELSGRALHVEHDLDDLIASASALAAGDRLTLRVVP